MRTWLFACVLLAAAEIASAAGGSFEKGTWDFCLAASYVTPIAASDDKLADFTVAGGYYLWNNHALNIELQGAWADQPGGDDAIIGGIGILGRFHLFNRDPWSFFLDGGIDFTYADHEVPQSGTHFNFEPKIGLGATYRIADHTFLIGGVRYFHISNAQIQGSEENPNYNGVQIWAGTMWTW